MPAVAQNTQRTPQREKQRGRQPVTQDQFHVDHVPAGMSYEWKRVTFGGKEDIKNQANAARNGFTPVPASRHPELVGARVAEEKGDSAIIVDGLMLMERPIELRREADAEEKANARSQVVDQATRLKLTPEGQMPRKHVKASSKHDIPVPEGDNE